MDVTSTLERILDRSAKVVVVGQGYVGLPVAMRASQVGFTVVGLDASAERVDALRSGRSYVGDISDAELGEALARGYQASTEVRDCAGFDIAVVSVPTPLKDGLPDLTYIEQSARSLGRYLRPGACVILESTTYPGTTTEFFAPILEDVSGLRRGDYFLGYSPERIDPGNATYGLVNTPKVVSGADPASLEVVDAFFTALVDQTVPVGSCEEAELVKLLENTFRHVNIALVNELAMFARDLGVDVWRAIDAASTKPFGYMRFTPGPGVGGHCLPIDPSYLAWRVKQHLGHTFRFVELANDVNEHMPDYVHAPRHVDVEQRAQGGERQPGPPARAGVQAGNQRLAREPIGPRGRSPRSERCRCSLLRPVHPDGQHASTCGSRSCRSTTDELEAADVVVVLVDHLEFDPDVIASNARLVFDTKNLMRGHELHRRNPLIM